MTGLRLPLLFGALAASCVVHAQSTRSDPVLAEAIAAERYAVQHTRRLAARFEHLDVDGDDRLSAAEFGASEATPPDADPPLPLQQPLPLSPF